MTNRDPQSGQLESRRAKNFEWIRTGPHFLPLRTLTVVTNNDGGRETQELVFSRHQLTPAAANR